MTTTTAPPTLDRTVLQIKDLTRDHLGTWVHLHSPQTEGWLSDLQTRLVAGRGLSIQLAITGTDRVTTVHEFGYTRPAEGWPSPVERLVTVHHQVCAHCSWPITRSVVRQTRCSQILGWIHVVGPDAHRSGGLRQFCGTGQTATPKGVDRPLS